MGAHPLVLTGEQTFITFEIWATLKWPNWLFFLFWRIELKKKFGNKKSTSGSYVKKSSNLDLTV